MTLLQKFSFFRSTGYLDDLTLDAGKHSQEDFLHIMKAYGCCKITRVFDTSSIKEALHNFLAFYRANDPHDRRHEHYRHPNYRANPKGAAASIWALENLAEPTLAEKPKFQLFQDLAQSRVGTWLLAYLGGGHLMVSLNHSRARVQDPSETCSDLLPLHQDTGITGDFTGPMLTCWVPFTRCGKRSPSLEVLPVALSEALPVNSREESKLRGLELTQDVQRKLMEKYGAKVFWKPRCQPGEVILLSRYAVHRTYQTPSMNKNRYSVDLRLFSDQTIPRDYPGSFACWDGSQLQFRINSKKLG